jgi:hypothetical protein
MVKKVREQSQWSWRYLLLNKNLRKIDAACLGKQTHFLSIYGWGPDQLLPAGRWQPPKRNKVSAHSRLSSLLPEAATKIGPKLAEQISERRWN